MGSDHLYQGITSDGGEVREIETFVTRWNENDLIMSSNRVQDAVFVVRNGNRHVFPDVNYFMAEGFEFSDVKRLDAWDVLETPIGRPLGPV